MIHILRVYCRLRSTTIHLCFIWDVNARLITWSPYVRYVSTLGKTLVITVFFIFFLDLGFIFLRSDVYWYKCLCKYWCLISLILFILHPSVQYSIKPPPLLYHLIFTHQSFPIDSFSNKLLSSQIRRRCFRTEAPGHCMHPHEWN